jgi:hypothetical protein
VLLLVLDLALLAQQSFERRVHVVVRELLDARRDGVVYGRQAAAWV